LEKTQQPHAIRQGWGWFNSEVLPWQVEVKQAIEQIEHLSIRFG
jgi:hypothetical protein